MSAAPSPSRRAWFLALARRYVRRRLRRGFDGVFVAGLARARRLCGGGPVIIAANHVCFWDPFLVVLLDQALGTESYCLMDRANLLRLPFFGWLGAIPVDRASARGGLRDLRAALALADRPGRALWIFPQGRMAPAHLRPLGFQGGVQRLAQAGHPVLPLALSYAYREAAQPTVAACFGEPLTLAAEPGAFLPRLEQEVVDGLLRNDAFILGGGGGFAPLIADRGQRVPLPGRLLAALTRPPVDPVHHG